MIKHLIGYLCYAVNVILVETDIQIRKSSIGWYWYLQVTWVLKYTMPNNWGVSFDLVTWKKNCTAWNCFKIKFLYKCVFRYGTRNVTCTIIFQQTVIQIAVMILSSPYMYIPLRKQPGKDHSFHSLVKIYSTMKIVKVTQCPSKWYILKINEKATLVFDIFPE